MKRNELTDLFGIRYPIIQAGMANVSGYELTAAISNCGGLGTIGAGYMSAETLRDEIRKTKQLTKRPFAVNLFIPGNPLYDEEKIKKSKEWLEPFNKELGIPSAQVEQIDEDQIFLDKIDILIEEQVPIVSFTFGVPKKDIVKRLKDEKISLIGTATNIYEAKMNAGVMDAVVVQGSEAGGHRGAFTDDHDTMIGLMALIPQVVDAINIPVIAAGGIVDVRGIRAAHALGADGVQLGSLFVNSKESTATRIHKNLINKSYNQTVMTKVFSGKEARGIKNKFISEMKPYELNLPDYPIQNMLTNKIRKKSGELEDSRFLSLWNGQGYVKHRSNTSAKTIFESLIESNV